MDARQTFSQGRTFLQKDVRPVWASLLERKKLELVQRMAIQRVKLVITKLCEQQLRELEIGDLGKRRL